MLGRRIATIVLSALGVGLLLLAFVLWARTRLAEHLETEQAELYLAYRWLPEPTIVPATATPFPTSTIPPTPTETPTPTPTPQPQPPTRLVIPSIGVNSAVRQVGVSISGDPLNPNVTWPELGAGVGHDMASVNPGESGNIILFGHNNYAGQVFRRLSELEVADEIHLYTLDQGFFYLVQDVDIVRAVGATEQDNRAHAFYLGPKSEETLTLVSCWPYSTYTHRVYVVAKPIGVTNQ